MQAQNMRPGRNAWQLLSSLAGVIAVLLGAGAMGMPAFAAQPLASDTKEALPTSRGIIAAMAMLTQPGFDETSLRAAVSGKLPTQFAHAGSTYALATTKSASVPRMALVPSGSGAVAYLVALPTVLAGLGASDASQDAHYALATVSGTRITIWGLYTDIPADQVLGQRMLAAVGHALVPLVTFDPKFTPGSGVGVTKYILP